MMKDLEPSEEISAALRGMDLIGDGEKFALETLGGGVSCDVFAVHLEMRDLCVKRALPRLRVAADWRAPPERSAAEAAWIRLVAAIEPKWVPKILGEDHARHLFAMEFFPPGQYPLWKTLLARGIADPSFAAKVGDALARIHASTAGRAEIGARFANNAQFHALRIEPYLLYTAQRHPDIGAKIRTIANELEKARIALMHGDVSPKNILRGPEGPVFLDAETACYGDPAFDLAFCLNHLLLKGAWHPEHANAYAEAFAAFTRAYFAQAHWEKRDGLEQRTAKLLPALLLARIDGKSPVEYLIKEADKAFVRDAAKMFFGAGRIGLGDIMSEWTARLGRQK